MSDRQDRQALPEDAALRTIVEGVESATGERFFASLVEHLAVALGVQYAFVSELSQDRERFRTLALWGRGAMRDVAICSLLMAIAGCAGPLEKSAGAGEPLPDAGAIADAGPGADSGADAGPGAGRRRERRHHLPVQQRRYRRQRAGERATRRRD